MATRSRSATLSSTGDAATATVAGSPYTVTIGSAMGTGLGNYTISYVNGTLNVVQKLLTVTADADSRPAMARPPSPRPTVRPRLTLAPNSPPAAWSMATRSRASTLSSTGDAATATVAGSPYAVTPIAAPWVPGWATTPSATSMAL